MFDLPAVQSAIQQLGFDGWLLYDFRGLNILARRVVGFGDDEFRSRRWFYFVPAKGEPRKLVHRIESGALDNVPGPATVYLRWQEFADAAFFYLNASVHRASPASTSIYGLAQWVDYHYYYGHVMWDIETFSLPPLLLLQPTAAHALLEYRSQTLAAARMNAKLNGREGLQFPWQSGSLTGQETMPGIAVPTWYEDHVSLDVAHAFAQYGFATGDRRFLQKEAAPVLYGVADWLATRVERKGRRYSFPMTVGIGERRRPADNDAFTIMSATVVLREAIDCAQQLGDPVPRAWQEIGAGLQPRVSRRTGAIITHDGFHAREEKGSTPDPLAGFYPLWYEAAPEVEAATIDYFLGLAPSYIGSPMLSPLYGLWAAWRGKRSLAIQLFEEGYADLVSALPADPRTCSGKVPRKDAIGAVLCAPRGLPGRAGFGLARDPFGIRSTR